MHNFRELKIWQKSQELVKEIYQITNVFPPPESYSLTSQIRRASVSISTNVAEGCGRETNKDFMRFLDIANGSAFELETLLILSSDLNYLDKGIMDKTLSTIQEIEKMIFNLKIKLIK